MSAHGQNDSATFGEAGTLQHVKGDAAVLVPLRDGDVSHQALDLARTIAIGCGLELVVLNAVCLPEQTPLDIGIRSIDDPHQSVSEIVDTVTEERPGISTFGTVHIGRNPVSVLDNAVEQYNIALIVVDDSWNYGRFNPLTRTPVEKLAATVDPLVVQTNGKRSAGTLTSILVPIGGGPYSGLAIDISKSIAIAHDAHIELLHVVPDSESIGDDTDNEILNAGVSRLQEFDEYDTWLLEADNVADAIVEQSQYYPVTVIGGPQTPRLRRFVFGSKSMTVREAGSNGVITVWG